jgi:hypothetical protein
MIFGEEDKPPLAELVLVHHGVKGMKWGVRKELEPTNPEYSRSQQNYDHNKFGKGGVRRINRHLNNGLDISSARKAELKFRSKRSAAIVGAVFVAKVLLKYGPVALQIALKSAEGKRGRVSAANQIARLVATKQKRGAYKITTL